MEEAARLFNSIFNSGYCFFLNLIKENNSQLKKKLHNLEEALESTRQSAKNEEHKSNLLIAEKVKKTQPVSVVHFYKEVSNLNFDKGTSQLQK